MVSYRIFEFSWFQRQFSFLPLWEKMRVERFILQIAKNGPFIGKSIRYPFFREKKFNGKRLYFLVYEEWHAILLADISDKKGQPETIHRIVFQLEALKNFVGKKINEYQE